MCVFFLQKTLPKVFENLSEKTAIKQFSHYLQLVLSNKFRAFDYNDPNINKKMYQGQTSPPDYKLENVSAHLYLYHGSVDLFVSQIVNTIIFYFYFKIYNFFYRTLKG